MTTFRNDFVIEGIESEEKLFDALRVSVGINIVSEEIGTY